MEEKLKLKYPVIVEGKYDKAKVSMVVSTPIITLEGFAIFNNNEKKQLLKRLSRDGGVILLTDSDRAGNFIRVKLKGILNGKVYNVFAPSISGKERRKLKPSADGLLGVEGMEISVLKDLLEPFSGDQLPGGVNLTRVRFYEDGFIGSGNASVRRMKLANILGLPTTITSKSLFEVINLMISEEDYVSAVERINDEQ